mmetsp:Transcript_33758/g.56699  ORF Transcript_33758/g.56699 Transcript_33758/m.56699 type:complete len:341 (+) Transcript_33758:1062-2084(+)
MPHPMNEVRVHCMVQVGDRPSPTLEKETHTWMTVSSNAYMSLYTHIQTHACTCGYCIWFFLITVESFALGERFFQLPGLGSFLFVAANQGNYLALFQGLAVVLATIVLTDFLVWRPLISWSNKFKLQQSLADASQQGPSPSDSWASSFSLSSASARPIALFSYVRRSPLVRLIFTQVLNPVQQRLMRQLYSLKKKALQRSKGASEGPLERIAHTVAPKVAIVAQAFICVAAVGGCGWSAVQAWSLLRLLSWDAWKQVALGCVYTSGRVVIALILSLLWAVPVGVAIGRDPKLARIAQPIVQIAASVPATGIFPVFLLMLSGIGGGLDIGSILLMMLGTMW